MAVAEGIRALAFAVLQEALLAYLGQAQRTQARWSDHDRAREQQAAQAWIRGEGHTAYSFDQCCAILGLSAPYLRRLLPTISPATVHWKTLQERTPYEAHSTDNSRRARALDPYPVHCRLRDLELDGYFDE